MGLSSFEEKLRKNFPLLCRRLQAKDLFISLSGVLGSHERADFRARLGSGEEGALLVYDMLEAVQKHNGWKDCLSDILSDCGDPEILQQMGLLPDKAVNRLNAESASPHYFGLCTDNFQGECNLHENRKTDKTNVYEKDVEESVGPTLTSSTCPIPSEGMYDVNGAASHEDRDSDSEPKMLNIPMTACGNENASCEIESDEDWEAPQDDKFLTSPAIKIVNSDTNAGSSDSFTLVDPASKPAIYINKIVVQGPGSTVCIGETSAMKKFRIHADSASCGSDPPKCTDQFQTETECPQSDLDRPPPDTDLDEVSAVQHQSRPSLAADPPCLRITVEDLPDFLSQLQTAAARSIPTVQSSSESDTHAQNLKRKHSKVAAVDWGMQGRKDEEATLTKTPMKSHKSGFMMAAECT